MAPETRLNLTRFARGQQHAPFLHYPRQVLGMIGPPPPPTAALFRGQTRIFLPTLVRALVCSVGQIAVGLSRNGIDNLAKPCRRWPRLCQSFRQFISCCALPGTLGDVS